MKAENTKTYAELYSDELKSHSNTRGENKLLVQENLEMKKQNTELAKVLRKSIKIIKQWEIDESK